MSDQFYCDVTGRLMQRKKILYLSRAVFPSKVAHTLSIMRMCQAFVDAGHEVTLVGRANPLDSSDPIAYYGLRGGFRFERFVDEQQQDEEQNETKGRRASLRSRLKLAMAARRLIRKIQPDFLYSRLTLYELFFVPYRLPIVFEMHSLGPLGHHQEGAIFHFLTWLKSFRRIVVTTSILAEMLRERLPGIEIIVARLSAEPPIVISAEDLVKFREANLQGKAFKYHVGYTGSLDKRDIRGTSVICKAASEVPEAAFHVVGGDSEVVDYWHEFAKAWNRHGNLFFYGHRKAREIPFFLGCFDVVLAPQQFRPLPRAPQGQNMSPLKLPQYMAYGKAIIASDLLTHQEVLRHGETAYLVPPADIEAWVAAIRKLIDRADFRSAMGERARTDYFAQFTPDGRVRRILEGL